MLTINVIKTTWKIDIPGTKKFAQQDTSPEPAYTRILISAAHKNEYPFSANITPNATPINIYPVKTGIVYGNAFLYASLYPFILLLAPFSSYVSKCRFLRCIDTGKLPAL